MSPEEAGDEAMRRMSPMLRAVRESMYLDDGHPDRVAAQAEKQAVLALIDLANSQRYLPLRSGGDR